MVRFEIGPVSMRAAKRWLAHARASVVELRESEGRGIPSPVLDEFDVLLAQWSGSVDRGDLFHWESFVPVDRVRRLSTFWAVAARAVRSVGGELTGPPSAARPFYDALVSAVSVALASADAGGLAPTFGSVLPRFDDRPGARVGTTDKPVVRTRLLIVEDTPDVRLLLRLGLRDHPGLEVVGEASDGLEALTAAAETSPDAVLLDLSLPRMSGIDALPHLRALLPSARIVAFSASSEKEAEAISGGADTFLLKGAARDVLAAALLGPPASR